jgi:hypothetical protein
VYKGGLIELPVNEGIEKYGFDEIRIRSNGRERGWKKVVTFLFCLI